MQPDLAEPSREGRRFLGGHHELEVGPAAGEAQRPAGKEPAKDRDRAADLHVDRGGERARDLEAGALGLLATLLREREQREPGGRRERQDSRRGEQQQPAAQARPASA